MKNKINVKNLSGQTSKENIRFSYIKRCSDKKLKEFTIIGFKTKFSNKFVFSLNIKKIQFLTIFNIIGLLLELFLIMRYRNIMVIIYTIVILIYVLSYVIFLNNKEEIKLHGAEHMMINSYETYKKIVDIETVKTQSIISYKCGSIYFAILFTVYVVMILTKFPIPITFIASMIFKIRFINKIFYPFEKILVKVPDEEQLLLAKFTFDLLIEIMEDGLEDEEEINKYILEYIDKCNEKN